jgi:UDP-N-acetylglucosamine pyrophosphorylase
VSGPGNGSEAERDALRTVRARWACAAPVGVPEDFEPPHDALPLDAPDRDMLRRRGLDLLRRGRVAVVTLAGGRSTRMGGTFRGDLPIGPLSGRTLFDLQGERVAAIRSRYAPSLQWTLLVSESTSAPVGQALARRGHFGLPPDCVHLVMQPSLPVLDGAGDPVPDPDGGMVRAPTGHGALPAALERSGVLADLTAAGVSDLFMFQYPNVLEHVCDPVLLGFHAARGHDATLKGVPQTLPGERVGRIVRRPGGRGGVLVLEYYGVPSPGSQARWDRLAMYTGTAVWSLALLRSLAQGHHELPLHRVPHREPGSARELWKLEQFVFDLLPLASSSGVVLGRRDEEYAPVKSGTGADSLPAARAALVERARRWLAGTGAVGPAGADVEIDPGYALDAEELAERLGPGYRYPDVLHLRA